MIWDVIFRETQVDHLWNYTQESSISLSLPPHTRCKFHSSHFPFSNPLNLKLSPFSLFVIYSPSLFHITTLNIFCSTSLCKKANPSIKMHKTLPSIIFDPILYESLKKKERVRLSLSLSVSLFFLVMQSKHFPNPF
jgi:hypothetical protein